MASVAVVDSFAMRYSTSAIGLGCVLCCLVAGVQCESTFGTTPVVDGASDDGLGDEGMGVSGDDLTEVRRLNLPQETDTTSALAALPLDATSTQLAKYIDIRGVGDSGWSESKAPLPATFGETLDKFGNAYRGDLSFINWETVVGKQCNAWGSASFYFLSHPDNLNQLYERGFNLIGLSNNHSRDCAKGLDAEGNAVGGERMTTSHMASVSEGKAWLYAGVGKDPTEPQVRTLQLKGQSISVSLGSGYIGSARTCESAVCATQVNAAMDRVLASGAKLRILALHCMEVGSPTYCGEELMNAGKRFVERGGDVVFGHGPHVWRPVYVIRKSEGTSTNGSRTGVFFQSLGNFAHPALSDQTRNMIGRALLDAETLQLTQVQVLPVRNYREGQAPSRKGRAGWSTADVKETAGNVVWSAQGEREGFAFVNVKP
jgi:poly-gamma-glutamate capsule biosynthesis protein CapA/YwtB (metallophosphatase superfamily)